MAPTPDGELSAPGAASYSSDTMTVGDGTWVFSKNTFLLPNLQGVNFETMRYNGMGNRFSTLAGYHSIILAHAVMAALTFLLIIPFSVMIVRFYDRNPGRAVTYHGQLQVLASLMLLVIFILGFFAVGPSRNLTNPHHGIGVAIFVLFVLQLIGGRLVRHITKSRSLRIMIHQWSGRTIGILGIVQIPLGMTLYGSPKYLFILYAVWMAFLVLLYFIFSYRQAGHRDYYTGGGARSEGGRTRLTESEYISDHKPDHNSKLKWLGPLAAGAGLWALLRNRKKKEQERERSRSPSSYRTRTDVLPSHGHSERFYDDKYSEAPQRKSSGGGFLKLLGGAAAALGAGGLAANLMKKRNNRDDEYSAVSTETPRRHRSGRGARSDYSSELTRGYTEASSLPPSAYPTNTRTTRTGDTGRPMTPPQSSRPPRHDYDDSEYSSYVSPSQRRPGETPGRGDGGGGGGGGFAKGILGGLGMGWIAKKMADRRNKKQNDRIRDEEDMRSGTSVSRFTGDGYPSPTRDSRRPPPARRQTGYGAPYGTATSLSEFTESSIGPPPRAGHPAESESIAPVPMPSRPPRSESRHEADSISMPSMPPDPEGVLHSAMDTSFVSTNASPPQRRPSERRRRAGERAAAAAAARASSLAAQEDRSYRGDTDRERDRYASPNSQPVSVKVKVHDDRDRNVTLRRLTEEEAMAARGRRDSESSLSGIESPSNGRGYRRASSSRATTEREAERRVEEEDQLAPLSPPNPQFARGRRAKDSAYYSGGAGPSGSTPAHGQTVSSLGSQGTHGTWSGMGAPAPSDGDKGNESTATDNRRRRRQERRRGSGSARPSGVDMFD